MNEHKYTNTSIGLIILVGLAALTSISFQGLANGK
jgi:hypothetical protein